MKEAPLLRRGCFKNTVKDNVSRDVYSSHHLYGGGVLVMGMNIGVFCVFFVQKLIVFEHKYGTRKNNKFFSELYGTKDCLGGGAL